MADNDELKVARLSNNSAGSLIDNSLANLETALATIFGITQDSDCENAMTISSDGDITMIGTLTLADDPSTDNEIATKQYVDNNTSTAATIRCQAKLTSDQTVTSGSTDAISWDGTDFEVGGDSWDAGAPTRLTIPEDGEFFITGNIHAIASDLSSDCTFYVTIKRNGSVLADGLWGVNPVDVAGGYGASVGFTTLEYCVSGDYFEVFVTAVDRNHVIEADYTRFGMMKVG